MPSYSASSTHQENVSEHRPAHPEAARAAEPESAEPESAEPEAAQPEAEAAESEAAPAADPDAWQHISLAQQWRKNWFINISHRVTDSSVLNDCHRLSDRHPLRNNYSGCESKKPTHLCVQSHFDEDSLIFCLAPIVSTFPKAPGGTPKQHRNPKDA